jgi:diguanylate cyclase (GGDEF)-like protein
MNIDRLIATISVLLAAAAVAAAIYPAEMNKALGQSYSVTLAGLTIVMGLVILAFAVLVIVLLAIGRLSHERNKVHKLALQVDALENELKRYREQTLVDVVTGIPNQEKLQEDVLEIAGRITAADQYQVIMLDLDRFGKINAKFGYRKGDLIIKYIAQSIYSTMRRNEEAYKRPFAGAVAADDLWRRIYRKYSGGDEFIFLIGGVENEALGFLLRLKRRFDDEFIKRVQAIVGEPWTLNFHAGVCRLNPGDKFETMLGRVEDCLRLARQEGSECRVFWASGKTSADFKPDSFAARIYADAERQFAL